jgi:ABC-2 type transport system ATP-binding protein
VLLLDEPTVGVDPQSRERIYDMLAMLQRDGMAIVLTTHQLEEAQERCARIVIIDHGRIVAGGTVQELVTSALGTTRGLEMVLKAALAADAVLPEGVTLSADRRTLRLSVEDEGVEDETRRLLAFTSAQGASVQDLALGGASLQDVFIALTGRELRE